MKSLTNNSIELELIARMEGQLTSKAKADLPSAVDYLNSAAEIFEDLNLNKQASQVLNILIKIANTGAKDSHVAGLTSEKMVDNLKNHGTVFNMADDGSSASSSDDNDVDIPEHPSFDKDYREYMNKLHQEEWKIRQKEIDALKVRRDLKEDPSFGRDYEEHMKWQELKKNKNKNPVFKEQHKDYMNKLNNNGGVDPDLDGLIDVGSADSFEGDFEDES